MSELQFKNLSIHDVATIEKEYGIAHAAIMCDGSHLYDIAVPNKSDLDIMLIVEPSVESILMQTAHDNRKTYSSETLDAKIWSIYQLFASLEKGAIDAIAPLMSKYPIYEDTPIGNFVQSLSTQAAGFISMSTIMQLYKTGESTINAIDRNTIEPFERRVKRLSFALRNLVVAREILDDSFDSPTIASPFYHSLITTTRNLQDETNPLSVRLFDDVLSHAHKLLSQIDNIIANDEHHVPKTAPRHFVDSWRHQMLKALSETVLENPILY